MQIKTDDMIEGIPILEIRNALRHAPGVPYEYPHLFARHLDISARWARDIVNWLTEHEYLEITSKRPKLWEITTKGHALASAKAAKPIRRATADRVLKEFLDRVREVNTNDYYLYKVTRVVLFGSYLSEKETLGDVDIALTVLRKTKDNKEHRHLNRRRVREAETRGKTFYSQIAEDDWAEHQTWVFLKSRSRSLSLHSWELDQSVIESSPYKVLYEEAPEEAPPSTPTPT